MSDVAAICLLLGITADDLERERQELARSAAERQELDAMLARLHPPDLTWPASWPQEYRRPRWRSGLPRSTTGQHVHAVAGHGDPTLLAVASLPSSLAQWFPLLAFCDMTPTPTALDVFPEQPQPLDRAALVQQLIQFVRSLT